MTAIVGGLCAALMGAVSALCLTRSTRMIPPVALLGCAVLGSQFAVVATVLTFFLFRERLPRVQMIGVVVNAIGVAVLTGLQAA